MEHHGEYKTRSWLQDNILGIIIALMFSGFWWQYTNDLQHNADFKKEISELVVKLNNRQLTICQILVNSPDTDPYYKELLKDWIKLETRGR